MRLALLAILLLARVLHADDGKPSSIPSGRAVEDDNSAAIEDMRKQLEENPDLREALVDRMMLSKIAGAISDELDDGKKRSDVRSWVQGDTASAAEVALGLAKDEADGTRLFENTLVKHLKQTFRRNNTNRGAFGVLKDAAKTSRLAGHPDQRAGEEEKRELLRSLFEGKGSHSESVITGSAPTAASDTPMSAALANSFYDRLSADNMRGYSPQLLSFQNELNARRPPGALTLVETGKLDHKTLSYPAYGLRYDLGNLEARLRRARLAALAALGGVQLTERDMKDPNLEARLLSKTPMDRLPKRFLARAAANGRAKAALEAFETAAARSKDPNQITKALLIELSDRQREVARRLTAASLEEELARVESEEGFLTADLLAAVDAVPAPVHARESYKRRGESYQERVLKLKANAQKSLDALQSSAWLSRIAEIEPLLAENRNLRRNLSRDIADYRLVPYRVVEGVLKQPRWREIIDDMIVKYMTSTSSGRKIASRREKRSRFLGIFRQIASGDLEGAHLSLVNAEGAQR